ncbi:transmembrane protein 94 isoform X2 [Anoplophora glabripennis]|uniref:transmembrane protein 94 isoform X2 n=1 Tax=Anoplophora glabripennis TaxID=217634 RepID=UPI0008736E1C|nr:transmembrane protein 94 isoform X2 [Anoplophora glabripennis]
MEIPNEDTGLNTRDALNKLYVEIDSVLQQYKHSQKSRKSKSWVKDALSYKSRHTTINIVSVCFGVWAALSLLIGYLLEGDNVAGYEALPILTLIVINVALELYDNRLRHNEIPNRVRSVLNKLKKEINGIYWTGDNYPNLCSPLSPCITLQWTYRDNKLVNLPWALLVKDDIILMRPGQISPGYCEAIEKHSECPLLHAKEVYSPSIQNANEIFSAPKSRKPLEPKKYRLLETPYLNNLKVFLEQALDKPITQLNQQRHLVTIKVIERVLLPITFILVLLVNLFRYFYFHKYLGRYLVSNTLFIVPSNVILPLLPLVFPLVWNVANYVGMARFKTIFDVTVVFETNSNPLEEDADNNIVDHRELKISRRELCANFKAIIKGKPEILTRSSNILHVLGSVTALGCIDKKGILSWPNPTAEKVFFLHNNMEDSPSSSLGNVNDLSNDADSSAPPNYSFHPDSPISATAEVLDLTPNHNHPFELHFDDHDWQKYLPSLKPLGLAILLNTCNYDTQECYTAFCSHITCEAIYNENLVPVTNRRCLCELAKEIGFMDQAQKIFSLEEQLSTFRHLQPEMVRRDNKYARSLQLSTKLKFPFPHMFAVVVKELSSGNIQLLSEGTADIILDSCVDYWDGHDLMPLMISDRKKIQDFYQRSSLTAYCTAFAYRPLTKCVNGKLSTVYLELPSDSRHLYINHRSPTPAQWDCKSVLEPKIKSAAQFYSTDSLLYNDYPIVGNVSDAESCFQMQCNQIFIGMVTMQYQAMTDMVQLIEQLERACIRFVHFSKENELRSRVFSEKMGLESGWNCHISLLSERNSNLESSRTMSFSAPSAINMEHSIVKFDTEVEKFNIAKRSSEQSEMDNSSSHGSVTMHADSTTHDWQSLSNLTESTEQSAPINFDMSNRAKLPRGIEKIRPHIELIDNVPLLVSLFTDCTPTAIREMLIIMQEYREIVCIMGSSENCDNAGIFMQADASVSVEPLYPQVCQKKDVYYKPSNCLGPVDISRELNSMACSLSVKREDPIMFYHLIMEARHFVATLWSSVQFWLCCCVCLSLMQVLATVCMLPGLLTTGQVLWFSCVAVPLISVALLAKPVDQEVMKRPQGKIQAVVNWDGTIFIMWCYGTKFLPTIVIVLASYIGILTSHCEERCAMLGNCTCAFFYNPVVLTDSVSMGGWEENEWTLLTSRLIISFIVLLHFVIISAGFVHRESLIRRKSPLINLYWLAAISLLIVVQSIYTIVTFSIIKETPGKEAKFKIPLWVIIFAAVSPLTVLLVNELIKSQEIMVNKRFLKRARLDFGTKLGMNSPF